MRSDGTRKDATRYLVTCSVEMVVASARLSPPTAIWTGEARSLKGSLEGAAHQKIQHKDVNVVQY
jgi:hypothetical protein